LERINPALPGNLPGSWRSSGFPLDTSHQVVVLSPEQRKTAVAAKWQRPTPGARNSVFAEICPPIVVSVSHQPRQPKSGEPVVVTLKVSDAQAVSNAVLRVQTVDPGKYIRYRDKAYQTSWTDYTLQSAGSNTFTATVPGDLQKHRRLVRYRVVT